MGTSSDQYSSLQTVAFAALAVWCGLSFCLIAICVYSFPYVKNVTFHRCTLALTVKYRAQCSWFVLLEMIVKFFACISIALYDTAAEQMQFLGFVYTSYMPILATCLPYRFLRHSVSDIAFTAAKVTVVLMSASFIQGSQDDGLAILLVVFIAYGIFGCLFISGVYLFLRRLAADPQRDFDMWYRAALTLQLYRVAPVQSSFVELAEDANPDEYNWKKGRADVGNALLIAAEQRQNMFGVALAKKSDLQQRDKEIIARMVPGKHSGIFTQLTDSQNVVAKMMLSREANATETKKHMEEQQGLIKQLFD